MRNIRKKSVIILVIAVFAAMFAIMSCKGSKGITQDERSRLESEQQRYRPIFSE